MAETATLYDNAYSHYGLETYRQVRIETYGEDLGQTSWVTTEESRQIPQFLGVKANSFVLEVGCGSGQYALQIAETIGCRVLGIDINAPGIRNANQLARAKNMDELLSFQEYDVSKPLYFADETFDAIFSNDVMCHVPGRLAVLRELCRVLKPGGRMLFSDALVIGGMLSHKEIAQRSSIGYYVFSPPGENEQLLEQAGFRVMSVTDTSESAAQIAKRWHDAREKRKHDLLTIEGQMNFEGVQKFLSSVHSLTQERRLLRYLYVACKST